MFQKNTRPQKNLNLQTNWAETNNKNQQPEKPTKNNMLSLSSQNFLN